MDTLVSVTLQPAGVWATDWQADTLLGALATVWARFRGAEALRRDLLEPWRAGEPPFVISDAFPEGTLPAPALLPLRGWKPEDHKKVKKLNRLSREHFRATQNGAGIDLGEKPEEDNAADKKPAIEIKSGIRMRNTIDRTAGTAGAAGGSLFPTAYRQLSESNAALTLFARTTAEGTAILRDALALLGQTGFGANASVGYGGFEVVGDPEPCPELDEVPDADGFISLSTFQPAPADPTEGYWRMLIKYGKLAPEFQRLHPQAAFKLPQVMLQPGACFRTGDRPAPFYGNAIGPERLFAPEVRQALAEHNVEPVHPAFALAVPMAWQGENKV